MKKVILSTMFLLSAFATQSAFAQGLHATGSVYATTTYISGAMNNRWNTTATTATTYIYANGFANGTISFAGRGADGTTFSCYVPTTSALYSAARDIKNNLGDGGYLYATKTTTSSVCTNVYLLNASYYLS